MRKVTAGWTRTLRFAGWVSAAMTSLSLMAGCDTMRGTPIPTPTPATVQVTAQEIAQAMQDDSFFSDYGGDILQVRGTVQGVMQSSGGAVVTLGTSIPTVVRCHVDGNMPSLTAGTEITVESPEGQREDGAVGLLKCHVLLGP